MSNGAESQEEELERLRKTAADYAAIKKRIRDDLEEIREKLEEIREDLCRLPPECF